MRVSCSHITALVYCLVAAMPVAYGQSDTTQPEALLAIESLGSKSFLQREAAMVELLELGADCLPSIVMAMDHADPEIRYRAATVIRMIAFANDDSAQKAARKMLEELRESDDAKTAEMAKQVLLGFRDDAIRRLQSAGGKVQLSGKGVRVVNLTNAKVGDTILRTVCILRPLELDLRFTKITNAGLEMLSKQTQLQRLNLQGTQITDDGMHYLSGLRDLRSFSIEKTAVTDKGMVHCKAFDQLTKLYVGGSKVMGPGLKHVQELPIDYLSFQHSDIGDSIVPHIAKLKRLETLGFDDTNVTNACVRPLANVKQLRTLWFNNSRLDAKSLPDLKRLNQLDMLYLEGVDLSSAQFQELKEALPDVSISK